VCKLIEYIDNIPVINIQHSKCKS